MSCSDTQEPDPTLESQVTALFARLAVLGQDRLHPIERDMVEALAARPRRAWCQAVLQILEKLVEKANGPVV